MKQKLLALLLVALLMPTSMWAALTVDDTFKVNGMTFKVTSISPNEVQVGRGAGYPAISFDTEGVMNIPSSVIDSEGKSYSVTGIGSDAFGSCKKLTEIKIPKSVTTIGSMAFEGCSGLKNFTIPEGIKSIGNNAFARCTNLESITIPKGITEWGYLIFSGCTSLTTVICASNPGSATCFDRCTALTNVTFTDDVTVIPAGTFQNCSGLKSIKIPSSVKTIKGGAFNRCTSLTDVTLSEGLDSILDAFRNCSSLKSIVIPSSVTYLNGRNFVESDALEAVYVNLKSWCNNGGGADKTWRDKLYFDNVKATEIVDLVIPEGITKLQSSIFIGMTSLKSVTFPSSMTDFSSSNFSDCNALNAINIQDLNGWLSTTFNYATNPLKKAKHLFVKGKEVKDLVIPEGISTINDYAFYGCEGLTSVTFPQGVTSIGNNAFEGCTSLTSVTIPQSVTSIGRNAFKTCTSLTAVHISDIAAWCAIPFIEDNADCNPLRKAGHLFMNGKEVTDLVIPEGVTSISSGAFKGCKFSSVSIPSSLTTIGQSALSGANTVYIKDLAAWCKIKFEYGSDNPMSSCEHLFINGEEVTDIVIPDVVTSISDYAFYQCNALTSVTISSSVTSIGKGAFYNCKELKEVYSYMEEPPFDTSTPTMFTVWYLDNKDYDRTLYVPTGTKAKYVTNGWNKYFSNIEEMRNTFTLTYMVDGTVYKEYSIESGAAISPEAEPTKEGYTFSGWSEIPETMPANDVTVSGTFAINKYILTYKVDGEEYKTYEVEYGAAITPEAEPTKEGYTFSGWSEIPETMPANDVTIIGSFTENPVVIDIEPVEAEENINVENLSGQDLSNNVVNDVYYNVGDDGYDATDQSIVISQTTNMGLIADATPGSADVKENFNGMILKVAKGKGTITVNTKTSGNAQLVVQVGNGTPMLASKTEKGDVVFSYDVTEDTYVYIYAILGSSAARTTRAASDGDVRIYAVIVSPGATSIGSITVEGNANTPVYNLSGQQLAAPRKGLNIIGGKKVVVK